MTKAATAIDPTAGIDAGSVESPRIEQRRSRRFSTRLDLEIYWEDEYGLPCVSPAVVGTSRLEVSALSWDESLPWDLCSPSGLR